MTFLIASSTPLERQECLRQFLFSSAILGRTRLYSGADSSDLEETLSLGLCDHWSCQGQEPFRDCSPSSTSRRNRGPWRASEVVSPTHVHKKGSKHLLDHSRLCRWLKQTATRNAGPSHPGGGLPLQRMQ